MAMKYLFLTRWAPYPPLVAGDVTYTRNIIEHMAEIAKVDVLACETDGVTPRAVANVAWHLVKVPPRSKLNSLLSPLPNVSNRHHSPVYTRAMLELAPKADAIFVDHLAMAWCVPLLRKNLPENGPPVIFININHEASLKRELALGIANPLMRTASLWDAMKAAKLERAANLAADGFTAITTSDLERFRREVPGKPGILFMPGYKGPKTAARTITAETPRRICILGGRGPFHKQLVLRQTLDALAARGFGSSFAIDIVGGGMEFNKAAMAERYPHFNFLGYIEDLEAYFATVRLGLIPDQFGGGFKVRALTHVFQRLPMLAVKQAFAGMTLVPDEDFIAADNLGMALDLLPGAVNDLDRLNAVQNAAFAHCADRFDWRERVRDVDGFARDLRTKKGLPV